MNLETLCRLRGERSHRLPVLRRPLLRGELRGTEMQLVTEENITRPRRRHRARSAAGRQRSPGSMVPSVIVKRVRSNRLPRTGAVRPRPRRDLGYLALHTALTARRLTTRRSRPTS